MKNALLCFITLLLCLHCDAQQQHKITVPMVKMPLRHCMIEVKINETRNSSVLVDTGSSISVITEFAVKALQLPITKLSPRQTYARKIGMIGTVVIPTVSIGDKFVLKGMRFYVRKTVPFINCDGILGINCLDDCAVAFQWQKELLTLFYPSNISSADIESLGIADAEVILLTYTDASGCFTVNAQVGDKEYSMLLDTGGALTVFDFSKPLAPSLLTPVGRPTKAKFIYGLLRMQPAVLSRLSLQKVDFHDVHVDYLLEGNKLDTGEEASAILGLNVLGQNDLLIDSPARKMHIKRPAKP